MSAPESVVRAVMEALGCEESQYHQCGLHQFITWEAGWTDRGCPVAVKAADAAWVAARREALLEAAEWIEQHYPEDIWPEPCEGHMTTDRIAASMSRSNARALRDMAAEASE